ncbi:MAG: winged helix-turn-helix domain-containing protein [Burkholderiaceae bacterium]|nr:winged helix-turn-helix domain-containing protein [Burkholderiaceae bacterium]
MGQIRFASGAVLRPAQAQLLVEGRPAQLGGRALEVLCALAQNPGELVTKRELMDRVWPDVVVEENNLQVQISALRRLLGPAAIITVAGRGYRLVTEPDSDASSQQPQGAPSGQERRPTLSAATEADAAAKTTAGTTAAITAAMAPAIPLLEREDALQALAQAMDSAMQNRGTVCLVYGEAGIGKSSLCNSFLLRLQGVRVLRGGCEALFSPRPLGPVYDFVGQLDTAARGLIGLADARIELFAQILNGLERQPSVLLLEDLHWADAATLDLARYLGRRIQRAPALLVLTYRDDELSDEHPLRLVLGDLQQGVVRVPLSPLSRAAVEELARQAGRSAEGILATTGGNPFYVTELLEAGGLPATVRDAVRARVARQPAAVRALLELASTAPGRIEHWVVERLVDPDGSAVEDALSSGLLLTDGDSLRFRHELARRAVEQSIATYQLRRLHARMLDCLLANPQAAVPPARLVHHAKSAGRSADVLMYAPRAAEEATRRGAHREAAALYESALAAGGQLPKPERAAMLEACAAERLTANQVAGSLACYREALQIWQDLGRTLDQGRALARMSRASWYAGLGQDCERFAGEAEALLSSYPGSREYLEALAETSRVAMLASRYMEAIEIGSRGLALAEQRGDERFVASLLNSIGTSRFATGDIAQGQALLERSLAISIRNRDDESTPRAYINLICQLVESRMYGRAEELFEESAKAFFVRNDVDIWDIYSGGWRARTHFERGRWSQAQADAIQVLSRNYAAGSATIRFPSLWVMARLKVARADPDAARALQEVSDLAAATNELQRLVPAATARCESLWLLRASAEPQLEQITAVFEACKEARAHAYLDELGYWLWLHGVIVDGLDPCSPRGLQIAGRWREAAEAWSRIGCPLEQGQALLQGDAAATAHVRSIFENLGATAYLARAS